MKPNDTIEHLVEQLKYRAAPGFCERACKSMLAELDKVDAVKPQPLWRIIMTRRTTYYIGAVSALVALAIVVLPSGGPLDIHGVVLAEVIKKTEGFDTLTHREKRVFYKLGEEKPILEATVFKQASRELGLVERQYDADGNLTHVAYLLKKEKRFLLLLPRAKRYLEWPLPDAAVAMMENLFSPQGLVQLMTRHGYTKLEPTELDGRKVEGFEMSKEQVKDVLSLYNFEKFGFIFPVKEMTTRLWVDVETSLPVRAESDFTTGRGLLTGGTKLRCHFEAYDLQWGANIDPEDFVPHIPDDYERIGLKVPDTQDSEGNE